MKNIYIAIIISVVMMTSCTSMPDNPQRVNSLPTIYPDYIGVTIPVDIVPLNFNFASKDNIECMEVTV